jgi:hypothetical protein
VLARGGHLFGRITVKRTSVFVSGVSIAAVAVAACGKPHPDNQETSKPIAAPVLPEGQPTNGPAHGTNKDGKYIPTTDMHLIIGTMGQEAKNRPKAGVTAEPLFDALEEKAHITLAQRQQYMGQSVHAAYCAGGQTADANTVKLTVAMCEYPDDAAAVASLEYMNKTFAFDNTRREAHHAAVMTVIAAKPGDVRVDEAFKVFESL